MRITKNKINKQYLLNILYKSNSLLGAPVQKIYSKNIPFIFGARFNNVIIDPEHTVTNLKRSFNLLDYFVKKKKKILIVGNNPKLNFFRNDFLKIKNLTFYNKKWERGFLTNSLTQNNQKIDLIVLLPINDSDIILKESAIKKIPVISFSDIDCNVDNVSYKVFINDKSIKTLFVLCYLIRKVLINKNN